MSFPRETPYTPRKYRTARTITALILREMSTTYGRSPGGYLWAVMEPLGAITVLSLVFAYGFRTPALGTNFPLFFATGYLVFALYNETSQKITTALRFSKQLLVYPAVKYTDAIFARLILNVATQLMLFFLIIVGIHLLYDVNTILRVGPIVLSMIMAVAMGVGVGTMNCYLISVFPVWDQVWRIITRPLFLVSGIIFIYEAMPPAMQSVMWYNPLLHITGMMRRGFYVTYEADYVLVPFVFAVAAILSGLGFMLLYRHHANILNS